MPSILNHPLNATHISDITPDSLSPNNMQGKRSLHTTNSDISLPEIITGIQDTYDGSSIPNDNAIAVSNSGNIITLRNSMITFYNNELELVLAQSLMAFTESLNIDEFVYDPRVIYDPDENRFIIVMLSGFNYQTSDIIVCFSESDNPSDNWHFYTIPGNILNDETWSDYPIVAINENELFITVTNFADMEDFSTWDFYGCRIIQMNKTQGYNGDASVNYAYHVVNPGYAVDTPSTIYYYNITPVKAGMELYGPQMYFVSTLDCPFYDEETESYPSNDTVFLVEFSGAQNDPNFEITSKYLHSDILYGKGPNAKQPYDHELQTNYNTIRDAIYVNNTIHFTFNTKDFNNQRAGIFHGIINDVDEESSLQSEIISFDTMDVAFPSIAFAGLEATDQKILIGFNYSSEDHYPGNACLIYDNGNYSDYVILKQGLGLMNMTTDLAERWGDYTTIQIKHDEPWIAFFVGSYGHASRTRTWLSKILLPDNVAIQPEQMKLHEAKLFPNPVNEFFTTEFYVDNAQVCSFEIFDNKGSLVDVIIKHRVKAGANQFSFNIGDMNAGIYFLHIMGNDGFVAKEKFIVE
jgi:hypothetical protein